MSKTHQLAVTCYKSSMETTKKMCEICSKLTIKKPEQLYRRRSGVFNSNSDQTPNITLLFKILTLSK